jgi:ABC-type Mn2+/Zn2+ transport system permease subunit
MQERIDTMEENAIIPQEEQVDNSWKVKTLLIGAAVGTLTGLGAAFLLTRRAEQTGQPLSMTTGQGVKIGVLVAGLLRSILSLGED